mmetsp:Transcript_5736/g.9119  ORF Transcript_5736/g.9119 Transcript_5736/m.9119 type:complete len:83 (+) Transcript_5736:116-364(+)
MKSNVDNNTLFRQWELLHTQVEQEIELVRQVVGLNNKLENGHASQLNSAAVVNRNEEPLGQAHPTPPHRPAPTSNNYNPPSH